MDGSFLLFIIVLVVLVVIISKINSLAEKSKKDAIKINTHVIKVYRKLEAIESKLLDKGIQLKEVKEIKKEIEPILKPIEEEQPFVKPKEPVVEEKVLPLVKPEPIIKEQKESVKEVQPIGTIVNGRKKIAEGKWVDVEKEKTPSVSSFKVHKPSKSKADWEKLIGENLLNKIGIAILVIGIGFFVKFAIDKNWIGEYGRVGIGIGIGAILIGIAHVLRKNYKTFSSVLIGGGIGVFYYTISIAFQDYKIFSQPVAFGIMILITILAVVLSVIYDKKEIAIIGLIGGFTSPFMVENGNGNYVAFFTYIAILNSGLLALSYFKKWNIINKLAYGFTILFFGTWLFSRVWSLDPMPHKFAFMMSIVFYLQFLGMSLVYNIKHQLKFKALEFIQILSINALFFLAGITILRDYHNGDYKGLFTLLLAGFNLLIFFLIRNIKTIDQNLSQVFLGKVISFVTLAILLQFNAHYASLFWAIEAVVVLWIGQKNKQDILKQASVIITIIATFGLIVSWSYQLEHSVNKVFFNPYLLSGVGVIITYVLSVFLLNREEKESTVFGFPISLYKSALAFWAYLAFYITILIVIISIKSHFELLPSTSENEFDYYSNYDSYSFYRLIIWGYSILMVAVGLTFTRIKKINLFRELFAVLSILITVAYVLYGNSNTIVLRDVVLENNLSSVYFLTHFMVVGLLVYLFILLSKISYEIFKESDFSKWMVTVLSIFGVALASMELDHIGVFMFYSGDDFSIVNILHHTQREGYTTLWGIYSFLLMFYGMRKKNAHIRILSLILFAVTLLKLFILDIKNMSDAGKIIAFISLGVLLLIVSFLYQKLRKLIVGEELSKKIDHGDQ